MRYLSPGKVHRSFALGAALALVSFCPARRAAADSVELVSGERITGIVRRVNDGKLAIAISHPVAAPPDDKLFSAILTDMKKTEKPKPEDLRIVPLSDVVQIKFEAVTDRSLTTRPLIDNDRARNGRPVSASLKLRAGYHRFLLVYWHRGGGAFVRLAQSHIEKDNEDRQRFVRGDMLAHLGSGGRETPSPGLDKEGYRLPETLSQEVVPEAEYSVRRHPDGRPFEKMTDVLTATSIVSQGILDRISTSPFPDESDNLALLITGYLKIPVNGEYKFVLASDGGSQLYVGQMPAGFRVLDNSVAAVPPWTVTLKEGGSLQGTIVKWTDARIDVRVAGGHAPIALAIPVPRVMKVWSNKQSPKTPAGSDDKIDPAELATGKDVVVARSASGAIQHVPGRVQGIEGESLVFQFNGQNRKIALSKVAGIYLAGEPSEFATDETFHEIVEVYGGIKIPGQIASLDATTTKVRTQWGQTLAFKTDELVDVAIKNGKAISLTELQPREVQQVPFFDRIIGYRVNESLSGGPILLRDGKHSRGISVHAKTVLTYAIGGRFQRFRAKLGFQLPEGEMGDASIRVLGDDKPLFMKSSLRGDGPVEPLDLDVSGVETLTLAVDFGRHEDIGDRVVWADPTLIRSETGPYVRAQSDAPAK
ncbi:MAG TPA: NPCBM/NEW2 domain-containing protein [Planctomycetaceae bacterium]|nr:NPCBM/NEW2 domain-containing protein [Planctomycetaceae bacterium]